MLPEPGEVSMTPLHAAVLEALSGGGALFFRMLSDRAAELLGAQGIPLPDDGEVAAAIWDLVWAGLLTNDTLAPLRVALGGQQRRTPPPGRVPAPGPRLGGPGRGARGRPGRGYGFGRPPMPTRTGPPTVTGRWSLLPGRADAEGAQTVRAHALALTLLERHGVLTRGAVAAERIGGGFAAVYPVLRAMEEAGQCRRGYFVDGLGAAQFALPGAVDRMRALADPGGQVVEFSRTGRGSRGRRSGAALRGGAAVAGPARRDTILAPAGPEGGRAGGPRRRDARALRRAGRADPAVLDRRPGTARPDRGGAGRRGPRRRAGPVTVERADGLSVGSGVHGSPLAQALESAGFRPTPRGLRLRAS